jgi:SAM-dependent methyltransferase
MKQTADYDGFAWLYNREWTNWIESLAPGFQRLAGDYLPAGGKVLDLCCGTGQFAKFLKERSYAVTGADISADQLRYARKNAPEAVFIKADARSFKFKDQFDAVFCTYDALNHIMSREELYRVFQNVYACLKTGGIFVFDLITEREFEVHFAGREIFERPDYFYTVQVDYDKASHHNRFHCTLFKRAGAVWKRSDTTIYETFYTTPRVLSLLKKAGFTDTTPFAADPQRGLYPPDKKTTRIFYRTVKR